MSTPAPGAGGCPVPAASVASSSPPPAHAEPHHHHHHLLHQHHHYSSPGLPPPSEASIVDNASNPLSVLALMDQASVGLFPKLIAGGLSCMLISSLLNPMDVIKYVRPPVCVVDVRRCWSSADEWLCLLLLLAFPFLEFDCRLKPHRLSRAACRSTTGSLTRSARSCARRATGAG